MSFSVELDVLVIYLLIICCKPSTSFSAGYRISFGERASIDEFPFMAGIVLKRSPFSRTDSLICGATIVSTSWLMTAAHCLPPMTNSFDLSYLKAVTGSVLWKRAVQRNVTKIVIHQRFDPETQDYDLGMVKVLGMFEHRWPTERIISIAGWHYPYFVGNAVTAAGWGETRVDVVSNYTVVDVLRKVDLKILYDFDCVERIVSDRMIRRSFCAARLGSGKDTCVYDSGGPLIHRGTLIGIVSFGPDPCGSSEYPGVYVRLSDYYYWLRDFEIQEGTKFRFVY